MDKKWVYQSPSGDFTLIVRPTTKELVRDSYGTATSFTIPAIRLFFVNGFLTVNEALAKRHKTDVESLVKLVEGQHSYSKKYFLVQSPDTVRDKEKANVLEEEVKKARKTKDKVVGGVRAANAKG